MSRPNSSTLRIAAAESPPLINNEGVMACRNVEPTLRKIGLWKPLTASHRKTIAAESRQLREAIREENEELSEIMKEDIAKFEHTIGVRVNRADPSEKSYVQRKQEALEELSRLGVKPVRIRRRSSCELLSLGTTRGAPTGGTPAKPQRSIPLVPQRAHSDRSMLTSRLGSRPLSTASGDTTAFSCALSMPSSRTLLEHVFVTEHAATHRAGHERPFVTATHRSALFAHVPADVVKKHEATLQRLQQEEVEALASAQTARSLRLKSHRDAELHNLRTSRSSRFEAAVRRGEYYPVRKLLETQRQEIDAHRVRKDYSATQRRAANAEMRELELFELRLQRARAAS